MPDILTGPAFSLSLSFFVFLSLFRSGFVALSLSLSVVLSLSLFRSGFIALSLSLSVVLSLICLGVLCRFRAGVRVSVAYCDSKFLKFP